MSNEDQYQDPLKGLPDEIDGYKFRLLEFGYFVLEYSKRPMFGRYNNPNWVSKADLEENLLFDAKADTLEDAVKELKAKIREYRKENPE